MLDETMVVAVGEFGHDPQRGQYSGNGNSDGRGTTVLLLHGMHRWRRQTRLRARRI